jgi:hypothetical protein
LFGGKKSSRIVEQKRREPIFRLPFNCFIFSMILVAGGGFEPPTFGL